MRATGVLSEIRPGAVVNHGDYLTIDVAGLSVELVTAPKGYHRVMDGLTGDEWMEWCALPDGQTESDWLDARIVYA